MATQTPRRTKTPADPRLVDYPDELLFCRVDRHDLPPIYQPDAAQRWRYPDEDVLETERVCRRCGTVEIRQTREYDGTLYKPTKYRYPPGYKLPSVEGMSGDRVSPAAARLEGVRRYLKRNPIRIKRHG